jgi:hypothetical protein
MKPDREDAMNFSKYVYVSPQQYVSVFDEWRYEYVVDGKWCQTACFKARQGRISSGRLNLLLGEITRLFGSSTSSSGGGCVRSCIADCQVKK